MSIKTNIRIIGKVAEIIDEDMSRKIRVVCDNHNVLVKLNDMEGLSLGDNINLSGIVEIESLQINGIETKEHKY